jgi:hypothetical protein
VLNLKKKSEIQGHDMQNLNLGIVQDKWVKLRAMAAGGGGTDLHEAWITGFLGQHKNEMENKQIWGQKGLGRVITYINKIQNEFVQMGNEHLLKNRMNILSRDNPHDGNANEQ